MMNKQKLKKATSPNQAASKSTLSKDILCKNCKSPLHRDAKLCGNCNTWQTIKLSKILSTLAITVGIVAFLLDVYPDFKKNYLAKDNINLLSMRTNRYITILNNGENGVFIGNIEFINTERARRPLTGIVNRHINSHEVISHEIDSTQQFDINRGSGTYGVITDGYLSDRNSLPPDLKTKDEVINDALYSNRCFIIDIATPDVGEYFLGQLHLTETFSEELITIPYILNIHYFSMLKQSWQSKEFDVVGVVLLKTEADQATPRCV